MTTDLFRINDIENDIEKCQKAIETFTPQFVDLRLQHLHAFLPSTRSWSEKYYQELRKGIK